MKKLVYNTVKTTRPTKLSINKLTQYSVNSSTQSKIVISRFIKNEIKTRLAYRVVELENLPLGLSNINTIKNVTGLYTDSFSKLHYFKDIQNHNDSNQFAKLMEDIKIAHSNVEYDISIAVRKLISQSIIIILMIFLINFINQELELEF